MDAVKRLLKRIKLPYIFQAEIAHIYIYIDIKVIYSNIKNDI